MIVVSKDRYLPVAVNTLVLSKDDWYFYLHRDVYDQAVVLADRYDKNLDALADLIGGSAVNKETAAWFYENVPKPLHILAPYLQLIDGEIEKDMELCCGVLHVITAMIQVRNFILKPLEIRKSVTFSLSIKEEYELAWERFFASAIPYDQRDGMTLAVQRFAGMMTEISLQNQAAGPGSAAVQRTPPKPDETSLLPVLGDNTDNKVGSPFARRMTTDNERSATKKLLS